MNFNGSLTLTEPTVTRLLPEELAQQVEYDPNATEGERVLAKALTEARGVYDELATLEYEYGDYEDRLNTWSKTQSAAEDLGFDDPAAALKALKALGVSMGWDPAGSLADFLEKRSG